MQPERTWGRYLGVKFPALSTDPAVFGPAGGGLYISFSSNLLERNLRDEPFFAFVSLLSSNHMIRPSFTSQYSVQRV
jgi:hypothetical protein